MFLAQRVHLCDGSYWAKLRKVNAARRGVNGHSLIFLISRKFIRMSVHEKFTVGLIQMACSPDPDDNLRRAAEKVRSAAKQGAQMVCLPELFRTQYFCQREDAALFDLAEPIPGPTTEALSAVAREKKVAIVA